MSKKKDCCAGMSQHPDYSVALPRLNRIGGQIEGIKKMIDDRRYCPEILSQLRAVRSAVNSIEASILEKHLDACVNDALFLVARSNVNRRWQSLKSFIGNIMTETTHTHKDHSCHSANKKVAVHEAHGNTSLRAAAHATLHCLIGCVIGELAGLRLVFH